MKRKLTKYPFTQIGQCQIVTAPLSAFHTRTHLSRSPHKQSRLQQILPTTQGKLRSRYVTDLTDPILSFSLSGIYT